jgi:hypothetical protein
VIAVRRCATVGANRIQTTDDPERLAFTRIWPSDPVPRPHAAVSEASRARQQAGPAPHNVGKSRRVPLAINIHFSHCVPALLMDVGCWASQELGFCRQKGD